jgi:16S rRNA (guanine966-N2)-methyltransferase
MNKHAKHQQKVAAKGSIRIISGKHRGRKLPVLMAEGLRPTTDRVKETVFNWLMPYIQDSICLDCFAGSGGLGFEALSRGAEKVSFVELNKAAAKQLQENKNLLKANNVNIENIDVLHFLKNNNNKFNMVFIDPPFRKGLVNQVVELLAANNLADNALIYIEMESENSSLTLPPQWQLLKEKIAGQVAYRLYENKPLVQAS